MSGFLNSRRTFSLLVALACGAAFYDIGYRVLSVVHPAEDAYILFRYADHIAAGHGIVFNIGGPHAEGATDFLWLLLLATGVWLGVDVALAALALNAVGAALAGWLLGRICWGTESRPWWLRALLCGVLPSSFLAGGAIAGYWGFSSMLYSALILLLFVVAVESRGRAVLLVPVLGLVIALFRPDGVIVGVVFALLGLWRAWSERVLRPYVTASAACAAIALAYVAWRWNYFGLPLPLPLYVKQNGTAGSGWSALLPGLRSNWEWFSDGMGPHFILIGLAGLLAYARFWREVALWRLLVFLAPIAALLAALAMAAQTQNLEFRFQAPATLILLWALLAVAGGLIDEGRETVLAKWTVAGLVLAAATLPNVAGVRAIGLQLSGAWRTYVETFAPQFGPVMNSDTVVALTEAGAVPYWTRAQVADIVGLNYPEAAMRPPTARDLKAIDPDLVFLHQGQSLLNSVLIPSPEPGARVYRIDPERLRAALLPSRRAILERHATRYDEIGLMNVHYAPSVMIQFLSESTNYDIFVVDPSGHHSFVHVWGLKKTWPLRDAALKALHGALEPEHYRSYLDVRRGRAEPRLATGAVF